MDKIQLISRVRRGDERAVDELYYRTYQKPYTVVLAVVNSVTDAYGIMQDAYREAFMRMNSLSDFDGFRIAVNRLAVFMCAKKKKKRGELEPFSGVSESEADNSGTPNGAFKPEDGADYSAQRQAVSHMLENLPADERLALLAHCVLELGDSETAYSFGVSEGVAAAGYNDAVRRMKAQAARRGDDINIPDEDILPFIKWSFGKSAAESPVHEMDEEVRKAALSAATHTAEPKIMAPPSDDEQPAKTDEAERRSPQEYMPGEKTQPVPAADSAPKRKSHVVRNIVIISVSVLLLAAGVFAFIAFALPQITGEPNPISKVVTGKEAENTPEQLVEQLEAAFNKNDRDAMAKLFLPDQSLQRNLEGGALQLINGFFGLFNSGNTPQIDCELQGLEKDGETAEGKVIVSAEFPIVGKQSVTLNASFELKDYRWYFKELKT